MIYKLYTNNGDRLSIDADSIQSDGSGTKLFKEGAEPLTLTIYDFRGTYDLQTLYF